MEGSDGYGFTLDPRNTDGAECTDDQRHRDDLLSK